MNMKLRILILEDRPADAELMLREVRRAGYELEWKRVESEQDYIDQLNQGWELILADYTLPQFTGLRALELLKGFQLDIPLIVVSGTIGEDSAVAAMKAGANDYVMKAHLARLGPSVEKALREAAELREHKKVDEALKAERRQLRTLIDNLPDCIYVKDVENRFVLANEAVARRMGAASPAQLIGHTDADFHPGELASQYLADEREVLQSGVGIYDREERVVTAEGAKRWSSTTKVPLKDGTGSVIGLVGISRDITERKQAEKELRASDEKHRAIISASPVPMALNDEQDQITFLNPAFSQTFGYTLEDIPTIEHWWPKAFPDPEYRQQVIATWQTEFEHVKRTGATFSPLEVNVTCKNGNTRTVLVSSALLLNVFGGNHLVVLYDLTERKRADAELQKMQKLQSVGTLAGGIAHDFNNILLGLFGNISLAKDELTREHPGYVLLEDAEKSMNRAVRLTKQLLTFAKGGDPVKEDISLGPLVEEVARFDLSGSNVSLVFRQADDLWPAEADTGQIQQVVSNLTINARQAMHQSGHLFVTLQNADVPAAVIPGLRPGRYVKVTVRDEGTGIDPKVLDQIFDPYFTTKQTGSGLGLATVYSIIRKHNGHIGVVSELGKGTTFTFYLPAADSPQPEETKTTAKESPPPPRTARILVMDDEKMVRDLTARMLKPCGYSVATAPGGQEAIEMCKQAMADGKPFDAVIMDLTIPGGIGGKEVIKDLLAIDPHVKAIVSSGYADDPVMANYAEYGFKGAAAKPYTQKELREVLGLVLN